MECRGYCRVARYDLEVVLQQLDEFYNREIIEGVLCIEGAPLSENGAIFIFAYGVAIFWDVAVEDCERWLEKASAGALETLAFTEQDRFQFAYGTPEKISKRTIEIPDRQLLTKLAVSHAMSQSIRLGIFEQKIEQTIRSTAHIPSTLAETGRQPLSRKQLRRMMGQLYLERSSINLHFDLLDEPEFLWEHEELEPLYNMTRKYLDVQNRIAVLNQKLEVVEELLDVLSEELKHSHSVRLEWIIIWLIAVEVAFLLVQDFRG